VLDKLKRDKYISFHVGAFISLAVIVVWSVALVYFHLFEPIDFNQFEITALCTLAIASGSLIPVIWLRKRWGYLLVIIVCAIVPAGGVYAVYEGSYFFSFSLYNLSVLLVILVAIAGIILSYKAYRQVPVPVGKRPIIAVIGSLLLLILVAYAFQTNYSAIYQFSSTQIQNQISNKLNGLDNIEEKIEFLVDKGGIPSMVAGIVVDDQLVFSKAFGDANVHTAYSTGSVTKMFTATAVMQLYEEGLIDLDNDASLYLPFEIHHPEHSQPITVRNLLSHQSGLAGLTILQESYYIDEKLIDWLSDKLGWPIQEISPYPSLAEYLEGLITPGSQYYFDGVWLPVEPGAEHHYSNTNYYILATMIEHISGQSYSDYMRENVFDTLNMDSSGFDYTEIGDRYAAGYEREYSLLSKTNIEVPDYGKVPGAGGLISTVDDMSKFLISQLNEGYLDNAHVLTSDSIAMMHDRIVDGGGHINKVGYGLGFTHLSYTPWQFYGHLYGMKGAIGHEGGNIGYSATMYFIKEGSGGYGYVLLSNESTIEKGVNYSWYFPIYYKINVLLMEEATNRYEMKHGQ